MEFLKIIDIDEYKRAGPAIDNRPLYLFLKTVADERRVIQIRKRIFDL